MDESVIDNDEFERRRQRTKMVASARGGDDISGSDGGEPPQMETRVSRLETHMEYVRRDLAEIRDDLKGVLGTLQQLPTKSDLASWKLQWTALVVAAIAIVVGGIIGGLGWLETRSARVQPATSPTVVVVPSSAANLRPAP